MFRSLLCLTQKTTEVLEPIKTFELSKEYLESLREGIELLDNEFIIQSLEGVNVADIAAILDELNMDEAIYVLRLVQQLLQRIFY
jgi:magnesium transporter